mmetsp:Transcript_9482/g.21524  ORF Transcript_9482/g.21524 Transcript_9482/m.21524 type:complete len:291 (+) Transcript_9482:616-1488(+)
MLGLLDRVLELLVLAVVLVVLHPGAKGDAQPLIVALLAQARQDLVGVVGRPVGHRLELALKFQHSLLRGAGPLPVVGEGVPSLHDRAAQALVSVPGVPEEHLPDVGNPLLLVVEQGLLAPGNLRLVPAYDHTLSSAELADAVPVDEDGSHERLLVVVRHVDKRVLGLGALLVGKLLELSLHGVELLLSVLRELRGPLQAVESLAHALDPGVLVVVDPRDLAARLDDCLLHDPLAHGGRVHLLEDLLDNFRRAIVIQNSPDPRGRPQEIQEVLAGGIKILADLWRQILNQV